MTARNVSDRAGGGPCKAGRLRQGLIERPHLSRRAPGDNRIDGMGAVRGAGTHGALTRRVVESAKFQQLLRSSRKATFDFRCVLKSFRLGLLSLFVCFPAFSAELTAQLRPSIIPSHPLADREPRLGVTLGPTVGTGGGGIEVGFRPPGSLIGARVQWTGLTHETSTRAGGTKFDVAASSTATTLVGDWHFSGSGWRLGLGLRMGELEANLRNADPVSVTLRGRTYTAAETGALSGRTKWPAVLPQLTLGYVHRFDVDSPWSFTIDGGLVFLRSPKTTLTASGPIASDPTFQADLEAERAAVKERLSAIRALPILAFGVQYRF